ncbi:DnaJ domain-containing protein [Cryptosporidium serpentis]
MVWPLLAITFGFGALAVRQGIRVIKNNNILLPLSHIKNSIKIISPKNKGFENPMTRIEAYRILNLSPSASNSKIRDAHRQLMLRNHPDNGGSNYIASKVNEAKELICHNSK